MKKIIITIFLFSASLIFAQMSINLTGSNGLQNRIELQWQLENYGQVVFEDNFDAYSNGDLQFGDWTLVDQDNAPTIEFIDQNYHFPHANENIAWTIADWQNSNVSSHSLPNTVAAISNLYAVPNNDWLITPEIDLTQQTGFEDASLNFWVNPIGLGISVDPEHIKVLVSQGSSQPSDFTEIAEYFLEDKDVWKFISIPLTDYVGQNIRVAINYCSVGNVCVAIDDFKIWGYPDIITSFNVYRSTVSGENYELITQTNEMNYTDFTISPNETYYYVVSAILNGEVESDYSNEVSCYAVGNLINDFPYTIDFDNLTPPNLPEGCLVENTNNDDQTWETHNGGAYSTPNCLKYTYSSDNAADDWFFTPPISVLPNMDYHLSFYYRGNTTVFTEKLEVYTAQYASSQAIQQQIFNDDHINFNNYTQTEVVIHPQSNQPFVLGWHVYSDADQAALYVDDINLDTVASTSENIIPNNSLALSNFPNPFNPETNISFSLPNSGKTSLIIYNIKGQKIKTLIDKKMVLGKHSVIWNGKDDSGKSVTSGVYFYKLIVNGKIAAVKKCLLLK